MFRIGSAALCFWSAILVAVASVAQDSSVAPLENQPIASKRLADSRISFVAHHDSGESLWVVTEQAQVHVVDPLTLEPLSELQRPFDATICGAGLLPDHSGMLLGSFGGHVIPVGTADWKTGDWDAGNAIQPVPGVGFQSIAISPAGDAVALGTQSGSVAVIDMNNGEIRWTASVGETPINFVAWSRDGKQLAACSGNWRRPTEPGFVYVLDPRNGDLFKRSVRGKTIRTRTARTQVSFFIRNFLAAPITSRQFVSVANFCIHGSS